MTFDAANPQIYAAFERLAYQVISKNRQHYSAKCLFHVVRWESDIGGQSDFKIDDGWISHYSRKFARLNPAYGDLFTQRTRVSTYHR